MEATQSASVYRRGSRFPCACRIILRLVCRYEAEVQTRLNQFRSLR